MEYVTDFLDLEDEGQLMYYHIIRPDASFVIQNSNTELHTPEGGFVQLFLFEEKSPKGEDYVRIHINVSDNGIGMSPDFLNKIYESYSRADKARIHKTEGTGLGMAITKYIVDAMEGTIDV